MPFSPALKGGAFWHIFVKTLYLTFNLPGQRDRFNQVIYPKTKKLHPFVNGGGFILCLFPVYTRARYPINPLLFPVKVTIEWKIQQIILKVKGVFNSFRGGAYLNTKQRQGVASNAFRIYPNAPDCNSPTNSSSDIPNSSVHTYSVCLPRRGAGLKGLEGVPDNRKA